MPVTLQHCSVINFVGDTRGLPTLGNTGKGRNVRKISLPKSHSHGCHLTLNVAPKCHFKEKHVWFLSFWLDLVVFFRKKKQLTNYQISIFASVWRLLPWMVLLKSFWTSCCKARRRIGTHRTGNRRFVGKGRELPSGKHLGWHQMTEMLWCKVLCGWVGKDLLEDVVQKSNIFGTLRQLLWDQTNSILNKDSGKWCKTQRLEWKPGRLQ